MKYLFILTILILPVLPGFAKQWAVFHAAGQSEGSATGHVFVSFVQEVPLLRSTVVIGTWGFHPETKIGSLKAVYKSYVFGMFGPIEGAIRDDAIRRHDQTFSVEITVEELRQCLATKDLWQENIYSLTSNNCIDYLRAIALNIKSITIPTLEEIEFKSIPVKSLLNRDGLAKAYNEKVLELKKLSYGVTFFWPTQFIKFLKSGNIALERSTEEAFPSTQYVFKQSQALSLRGLIYSEIENVSILENFKEVSGLLINYSSSQKVNYSISSIQKGNVNYLLFSKSLGQTVTGRSIWIVLDAIKSPYRIGQGAYVVVAEECKIKGKRDNYVFGIAKNINVPMFKPVAAYRADVKEERLQSLSDLSSISCRNIGYGHFE